MEQVHIEKSESVLHRLNVIPKNLVYKPRGGGILTDNYDEEDVLDGLEDDIVMFVEKIEEDDDEVCVVNDDDVDVSCNLIECTSYEPWMNDNDYLCMLKNRRVKELHCYCGDVICDLLDDLKVFNTREVDKSIGK